MRIDYRFPRSQKWLFWTYLVAGCLSAATLLLAFGDRDASLAISSALGLVFCALMAVGSFGRWKDVTTEWSGAEGGIYITCVQPLRSLVQQTLPVSSITAVVVNGFNNWASLSLRSTDGTDHWLTEIARNPRDGPAFKNLVNSWSLALKVPVVVDEYVKNWWANLQ